MTTNVLLAGLVLAGGTLLAACASTEHAEQTLTLSQVPGPVRATIEREGAGGKLEEIESEVKDGKTVYSADIAVGGQTYDIEIAADGSIISKELETD